MTNNVALLRSLIGISHILYYQVSTFRHWWGQQPCWMMTPTATSQTDAATQIIIQQNKYFDLTTSWQVGNKGLYPFCNDWLHEVTRNSQSRFTGSTFCRHRLVWIRLNSTLLNTSKDGICIVSWHW